MKRLTPCLMFAAVVLALTFCPAASGQGRKTLTWDYDTTGSLFCSVTKPDLCIVGFDLSYSVGARASVVDQRASVSVCALQTGFPIFHICTAVLIPHYGTLTWTARAIEKDGTSELSSVDSNSVQITCRPRVPVSFKTL